MNRSATPPKLCVCKMKQEGTFDHNLGFAIGIFSHFLVMLLVVGTLVSYAIKHKLEIVPLYFGTGWVLFFGITFISELQTWTKKGHSRQCSRRYALLSLIFIRR